MRTIAWVGGAYLDNYDFTQLPDLNNFRLILLVGPYSIEQLTAVHRARFAAVYPVATLPFDDPQVELYTADALCAVLRPILVVDQDVVLYTEDEKNLLAVAEARKILGLAGAMPETLLPFRNKYLMKQTVASQVEVPRCMLLDMTRMKELPQIYFTELNQVLPVPFIVKPISLAGSYGVQKINSLEDWLEMVALMDMRIDYEVEEFIEGTMFHYDAVIQQGQVLFEAVCEDFFPQLQFLEGKITGSIPVESEDPLAPSLLNFGRSVIAAMNAPDGAIHLEFFRSIDERLVFVEVAARPGGAWTCRQYEQRYGLNIFNYHLSMITGVQYAPTFYLSAEYVFHGQYPIQAGKVMALSSPIIHSTCSMKWRVKVGDTLHAPRHIGDVAASIMVTNLDRQQLLADLEIVKKHAVLQVDLGH